MINISAMFEKFSNANYFSRVDSSHPLELHVGLDEKSRRAIELRAPFRPRKVTGTAAIEVNQYRRNDYNTIRFSLCDNEVTGLFYMFCEDLVEQTRDIKDRNDGYSSVINRFAQWKKMFVGTRGTLLTEPEIMGLIGELLYLRDYQIPRFGPVDALKSWSGQELTHKDFSYEDTWAEIKTIKSGGQTVKISSLEQLDSDNNGELAVYSLEKMSDAYNGITLNKLVFSIKSSFPVDMQPQFLAKTALQGYEYRDYYDEFVYEISGVHRYIVKSGFPRMTRDNLDSAIVKAAYEILLTELTAYEIVE